MQWVPFIIITTQSKNVIPFHNYYQEQKLRPIHAKFKGYAPRVECAPASFPSVKFSLKNIIAYKKTFMQSGVVAVFFFSETENRMYICANFNLMSHQQMHVRTKPIPQLKRVTIYRIRFGVINMFLFHFYERKMQKQNKIIILCHTELRTQKS